MCARAVTCPRHYLAPPVIVVRNGSDGRGTVPDVAEVSFYAEGELEEETPGGKLAIKGARDLPYRPYATGNAGQIIENGRGLIKYKTPRPRFL